MNGNNRVVVAISGGVDSATAAWLLQSQGYEVLGVYFNLWKWQEEKNNNEKQREKTRKVSREIGIPIEIVDARQKFKSLIINDFVKKLELGLTPNPCVRCNPLIKFKLLQDFAESNGTSKIATGHYAIIRKKIDGKMAIYKARDKNKDQTYFLGYLSQSILGNTIFPLGETFKEDNYKIARSLGLSASEDEESKDLCFLDEKDYVEFLKGFTPKILSTGEILNTLGKVIGQHEGLALFTIGQRKGIGISSPKPLYVIEKKVKENQLIVGPAEELGLDVMKVENVSWISGENIDEISCNVKIRYRSSDHPCEVVRSDDKSYNVMFSSKIRDITPGQFAAFYREDELIGAGMIQKANDSI